MLNEWFRLFERTGWLYEQRLSSRQWKTYPTESCCSSDRDKACLNALLLFLEGYAFQRAGCPPYFPGLAVDVLKGIGTWPPDEGLVWKRFKYALNRWKKEREVVRWAETEEEALCDSLDGLNTKLNPLAPKGTDYWQKGMLTRSTAKESIVRLAVRLAIDTELPLDVWVRDHLAEETRKAYSELTAVSGIADKLASLFMRDVACHYGVFPPLENEAARKLLQPIDIWERRTVQLLGDGEPPKNDGECQAFIVQNSNHAGCSPERVNQGIWYFCSQMAETEYYLYRVMTVADGFQLANEWLAAHVRSLEQVGRC